MAIVDWRGLLPPSSEEAHLHVSPRGTLTRSLSWAERLSHLIHDIHRIGFIVSSEAKARIFDKALGQAWLLVEPIIMAFLYYFISTVVFTYSGAQDHFLFIMTAVVFWRWFSKTVDGAPLCVVAYSAVLRQTQFSISLVIFGFLATEFFFFWPAFLVLVVFLCFFGYYPNLAYIFLPVVMLAQASLMLFLTLIFSMIGTFIKDLASMLYALTSIWWYLSPGIYPVSRIPPQYLWIYQLNPFAHILPAYRTIFLEGTAPDLVPLLWITLFFSCLSFFAYRAILWARYYFFSFL